MYNTYIKMKKDEYILHKGLDKFKKVYLKVIDSNIIGKLFNESKQRRIVPTPNDFYMAVSNIFWISIRFDTDMNIIAALIMLDEWNDKVNNSLGLATDGEMYLLATRIEKLITLKEKRIL